MCTKVAQWSRPLDACGTYGLILTSRIWGEGLFSPWWFCYRRLHGSRLETEVLGGLEEADSHVGHCLQRGPWWGRELGAASPCSSKSQNPQSWLKGNEFCQQPKWVGKPIYPQFGLCNAGWQILLIMASWVEDLSRGTQLRCAWTSDSWKLWEKWYLSHTHHKSENTVVVNVLFLGFEFVVISYMALVNEHIETEWYLKHWCVLPHSELNLKNLILLTDPTFFFIPSWLWSS